MADPKASQCTATSKTTGNRCTRPAIPGGCVPASRSCSAPRQGSRCGPSQGHGPGLGKHKDLRGALTAARKYWTGPSQRAKVTDWERVWTGCRIHYAKGLKGPDHRIYRAK
jgi:hypothetical protein